MSALDPAIAATLARDLAPADFVAIVDSFESDTHRLTEEMAAGEASGDRAAVHRAAHGLAGAAASIGAVVLEHMARRGLGTGPVPPGLLPAVRAAGVDALRALRALTRSDSAA